MRNAAERLFVEATTTDPLPIRDSIRGAPVRVLPREIVPPTVSGGPHPLGLTDPSVASGGGDDDDGDDVGDEEEQEDEAGGNGTRTSRGPSRSAGRCASSRALSTPAGGAASSTPSGKRAAISAKALSRSDSAWRDAGAIVTASGETVAVSSVPEQYRRRPLRVGGTLLITRTLGDAFLKRPELSMEPHRRYAPYVRADPEVWQRRLRAWDLFLVLGSDGVWEACPNADVIQAVLGAGPVAAPLRGAALPAIDPVEAAAALALAAAAERLAAGQASSADWASVALAEAGVVVHPEELAAWSDIALEPPAKRARSSADSAAAGTGYPPSAAASPKDSAKDDRAATRRRRRAMADPLLGAAAGGRAQRSALPASRSLSRAGGGSGSGRRSRSGSAGAGFDSSGLGGDGSSAASDPTAIDARSLAWGSDPGRKCVMPESCKQMRELCAARNRYTTARRRGRGAGKLSAAAPATSAVGARVWPTAAEAARTMQQWQDWRIRAELDESGSADSGSANGGVGRSGGAGSSGGLSGRAAKRARDGDPAAGAGGLDAAPGSLVTGTAAPLRERARTLLHDGAPMHWGGVRWTREAVGTAALPPNPPGSSAAERVVWGALRSMALRSKYDPMAMLSRAPGSRRDIHDDVTAVVVFLPGSRRSLLAPVPGKGQRTIDTVLGPKPAPDP